MSSSELITGLVGIAVVVGGLVGLLALTIVLQKRKARRMQEDRKRFVEVYGFTDRPRGGLQGVVGNSRMEIFLARLPIPAGDPQHPQRQHAAQPGQIVGINWADALQLSASCASDQRSMPCSSGAARGEN